MTDMAQWKTFSFQKAYLKFETEVLEHRNTNSGSLTSRKSAQCCSCRTKRERAGCAERCFCTRPICGYVASSEGRTLVVALLGAVLWQLREHQLFILFPTARLGIFQKVLMKPTPKVVPFSSIFVCFLKLNTRAHRTETKGVVCCVSSMPMTSMTRRSWGMRKHYCRHAMGECSEGSCRHVPERVFLSLIKPHAHKEGAGVLEQTWYAFIEF